MTPDFVSLSRRIFKLHGELRGFCSELGRIAIALYDERDDLLRTFIESSDGGPLFSHYEVHLAEVPSLRAVAVSDRPRVIEDLQAIPETGTMHDRLIREAGFRSSMTLPLRSRRRLIGFVFFDAAVAGYFDPGTAARVMVYARLINALLVAELAPIHTLRGAVNTAIAFSRFKDAETSAHLERMSHYARLVAEGVAESMELVDERIEFMYQFAPLHDIGKLAIPDHILLKPGSLDADEIEVMRQHVPRGLEVIEVLVEQFDLDIIDNLDVLRAVVGEHHENFDGSGYPNGLAGEAITPEGRIVKVADVLDALTSARPYKRAWTLDDAFAHLARESGRQFDPRCVEAILARRDAVTAIQDRYRDSC
ncbi:MAG: HD domain-containing protein [Ectothiorhodospiraceae bacterium]|nr:HD domain-containing protein [Planctomycetota bacterium]MCP5151760.1 HD domain-containing protein [Chromatiales bacterium]MCP5154291.1 HD domain-containing protein [Ectothiorhodospiraceae bacterium]